MTCSEAAFRGKRQVFDHKRNTCPLLLVADHRFFKHMGREEESTTLNYLVSPQSAAVCQPAAPPPKPTSGCVFRSS